MSSPSADWKSRLLDHDPKDFLAHSPNTLPQYGTYDWLVSAAIITDSRSTDISDTAPSALLVLQRKRNPSSPKYANWEMPNGVVLPDDQTVTTALERIIKEKTGLHLKHVPGAHGPIIIVDKPKDDHRIRQIKLLFAVSVADLPPVEMAKLPSTTLDTTTINVGHEYQAHHLLITKKDIDDLHPVAPSHKETIYAAFAFLKYHVETWHETMQYLTLTSGELKYTDKYHYLICASLMRPPATGYPPAILVLRRGEHMPVPGLWETPGGYFGSSDATLESALHDKVFAATGLSMKKIHGSLHEKPLIMLPFHNNRANVVLLDYLISVEEGAAVKVQQGYSEWKWVTRIEDVEDLKMSHSGRHRIKLALEAARKAVVTETDATSLVRREDLL